LRRVSDLFFELTWRAGVGVNTVAASCISLNTYGMQQHPHHQLTSPR